MVATNADAQPTHELDVVGGVAVVPGVTFDASAKPSVDDVIAKLGEHLVVKPNNEGSSVGLALIANRAELGAKLDAINAGSWLIEQRIVGRGIP